MGEQCQNVKTALIKLERVQGTFLLAQQNFPSVNASSISLTDAIDEALLENMTEEQAKGGLNPNACLKDMRCYRDWLSRAYRGTDSLAFIKKLSEEPDIRGASSLVSALEVSMEMDLSVPGFHKALPFIAALGDIR